MASPGPLYGRARSGGAVPHVCRIAADSWSSLSLERCQVVYRTSSATDSITERDGFFIAWSGTATANARADAVVEATIDVFAPQPAGWSRARSVHRQRHWPAQSVARIAHQAGLRIVATRGQRRGAVLDPFIDEGLHSKILFVACRDDDDRHAEGGAR
jgi:hypothetical protein